MLVFWPEGLTVAQFVAALDLDHHLVEGVVSGPAKSLFKVDANKVVFSSPSFKPFLQDASRSGEFFIEGIDPDPIFKQILSRYPPPDSPESYSCDELLDVLTALVVRDGLLSVDDIGTLVDLDSHIVEKIISGPAKALFHVGGDDGGIRLSSPSLKPFLQEPDRSGAFFVHDKDPDAFFLRILARHPSLPTLGFAQDDRAPISSLTIRSASDLSVFIQAYLGILGREVHCLRSYPYCSSGRMA